LSGWSVTRLRDFKRSVKVDGVWAEIKAGTFRVTY